MCEMPGHLSEIQLCVCCDFDVDSSEEFLEKFETWTGNPCGHVEHPASFLWTPTRDLEAEHPAAKLAVEMSLEEGFVMLPDPNDPGDLRIALAGRVVSRNDH